MHLSNSSRIVTCTRSGRKATLSATNCTRLKLILFLNNPCHIFSVGRDITFLGHTRGRVTVFFAGNWGRAEKKFTWENTLYQPSPPLMK